MGDGEHTITFVPLTNGTRVSHYKIISRLGAGGMGEVYLAHDEILDRSVALKFLRVQERLDNDRQARFLREARAAARLNHPNVVTVYELGDYSACPFMALEYLRGKTLGEWLESRQIKLVEFLDIFRSICDAVASAHQQGIIHRDLKPSNIMLDDSGTPKIVDFGLASLRCAEQITRMGSVMGTPGYMSKEQAEGRVVDERTDLFSLGAIGYEMLSGQNPFRKDSDSATLQAVLYCVPKPLSEFREDIPGWLNDLIMKLLEKNPEDRIQTASLIVDCIDASPSDKMTIIDRGQKSNSLAVMHFENLTGDISSDRLGELMRALLITGLSELSELNIVSRQRLYDLQNLEGLNPLEIPGRSVATRLARIADAKWMLIGCIVNPKPLAVITELIDIHTGELVSSRKVSADGKNQVFDVVDMIIANVSKDLKLESGDLKGSLPAVSEITTKSREAYECYLRGIEQQSKQDEAGARAAYEAALEHDPTFCMAYFGLASMAIPSRFAAMDKAIQYSESASAIEQLYIKSLDARLKTQLNEAIEYLKEIVEKHPDEKLANYLIGVYYHFNARYEEAKKYLRRAIELDPQFKLAHNQLAYTFYRCRELEESIITLNRYKAIAPNEPNPLDSKAEILGFSGRLNVAIEICKEATSLRPLLPASLEKLGLYYLFKKDYQKAEEAWNQLELLSPRHPWVDGSLHQALIPLYQGKISEALDLIEAGISADRNDPGRNLHIANKMTVRAWIYMYQKDYARAIDELLTAENMIHDQYWHFAGVDRRVLLAWNYARIGNVEECRRIAEQIEADARKKNLVFRWSRTYQCQGLVKAGEGRTEEGRQLLERSIQSESGWPGSDFFLTRRELAKCCIELGIIDRAVELLESTKNCYALSRRWYLLDDVEAHYYLGRAYEASGWKTKAIDSYEEFLEIWKNADKGVKSVEDARERLSTLKEAM